MDRFAQMTVDGVSKSFGPQHRRHVAVDAVTLEVTPGSRIGVVGESGSGKSTLARMMVGLDAPSAGSISFNGAPLRSLLKLRASRLELRREVQFVAQDTTSSFDPLRTLRDSIRTPAQRLAGLDRRAADARVDATVSMLGLSPALADRHPGEVSGGQRQRFAIARALVVEPNLLVCDEVVSALDVSVQGSILNFLKRYCVERDAALVFVSHGLPATAFVCERLVVMRGGQIVEDGPTSTVLNSPRHDYTRSLLAAFRGPAAQEGPA
ncbi:MULTISPECIES: ABC transporter ATP-binding protein [Frankia]|uniref:Dipeptide transport protein (ABC superfamily, atp_bind) (Partial) n=1 Tax=Frankia alni (strain DSM 45986 / CECT 9034 / ACN14a) TaxID=326424 RepID=Q0RCM1_FRAAA|nr:MULTISPECIES: ABC transporter ATP-binding protein [Frankia]CAJ64803.1 Dipeptide transport protein (ABC superfamily, atp_bind) (partial) [Frankia alni ACN14a]